MIAPPAKSFLVAGLTFEHLSPSFKNSEVAAEGVLHICPGLQAAARQPATFVHAIQHLLLPAWACSFVDVSVEFPLSLEAIITILTNIQTPLYPPLYLCSEKFPRPCVLVQTPLSGVVVQQPRLCFAMPVAQGSEGRVNFPVADLGL